MSTEGRTSPLRTLWGAAYNSSLSCFDSGLATRFAPWPLTTGACSLLGYAWYILHALCPCKTHTLQIPFVPLTVLTCQLVLSGGTRHLPYLAAEDPENLAHLIKTNWIAQPFGIFCLGMGKVAISLLLVRLLQRAAKWRKWFLHGLSIWTVLNTICMIVLTFVQCEDVRALWQQELKATVKCWDPSVQSNFSIYGSSKLTLNTSVLSSWTLS